MSCYYLEKEFYDYADDIEGVNIHYLWTPLGGIAEWENQRATRFMPLVQSPTQPDPRFQSPASGVTSPTPPRLRKKLLKLPQRIPDPETGAPTDRYLLYHYFEVFQDGHRYYSPLYTEEVVTGAGVESPAHERVESTDSSLPLTTVHADMKEAEKMAPTYLDEEDWDIRDVGKINIVEVERED